MSTQLKSLKTPKEALNLAEKNGRLGYQVGDDINPAGEITKITDTGKTIVTNRGLVFKYREAYGRFSLKGNFDSEALVWPDPVAIAQEPVSPRKRGKSSAPKANDNKQADQKAA